MADPQLECTVSASNDAGVMGDHDGRAIRPPPIVEQGAQHNAGRVVIEIAGWFVGKYDGRLLQKSPGHGDPLALPARQLGGAAGGESA